MTVSDTPLEGLKVVELKIYRDSRGFFMERFNASLFKGNGLPVEFPQDNHSRSIPKVVRGLHYQSDPAQGKLVGVLRGAIWDVAVDIRPQSKTYGKHFSIELTDDNGKLLWIPPGFAHGFCVLGDVPADVLYKVTALYNPKSESGIRWNDPDLNLPWPVKDPIVSDRDRELKLFRELKAAQGD